jgi:hypothetical protein
VVHAAKLARHFFEKDGELVSALRKWRVGKLAGLWDGTGFCLPKGEQGQKQLQSFMTPGVIQEHEDAHQGLKPTCFPVFPARLKSCPDTVLAPIEFNFQGRSFDFGRCGDLRSG